MKNFAAAIMLAIGAYASSAKQFNGAELRSQDSYKYGRFVTSMKASMAKGTASAFYLQGLDDEPVDNYFDEWNAMCVVPSVEELLVSRMNFKALNEDWQTHAYGDREAFHTYEIEWTPDYLAYKYDGQEIRRREGVQELHEELHLVMSIMALKGEDHGNVDPEALPTYTAIDYVEVYSYNEATDDFNLNFRDNFNQLDEDKWELPNEYTWDEVNNNIVPQNVSVDGEHLVLKLDKNPNYKDEDKSDDDHESDDEDDFHVLPAPKDGTLDQAIEKATRVAVTMVRTYLDHFSENMGQYLSQ